MTNAIKESRTLAVREADGAKSGRLKVGLISPGWGSSGYYSDKVLENAATAQVFPAGTQMFLDHETESEKFDRPERSVRDLAAVLTEDAVWDGTQLVAEAQVFGPFVDMLTDENFAKAIGVSIRALADSTVGEAEGRKGRIITLLDEALSVDFVTRAGRGGQVLEVLESARGDEIAHRAEAHGVSEATSNDTLEALQTALKDTYGGDKSWVWVRDFDEATVWFTHETPDETGTYAQAYTLSDSNVAELSGDRTEVRARTEYVPVAAPDTGTTATESGTTTVPAPAGQTHPTHSSKEDTMGNIQVDESQHAALTEAAGRVPTLESERDTANQRADVAERKLRDRDNSDAAREVIATESKDAGVAFTALESRGLIAEIPVDDQGDLDKAKFAEAVKKAAADKAQEAGAGSVTGFGATHTAKDTDVIAEAEKAAAGAFGRQTSQEG